MIFTKLTPEFLARLEFYWRYYLYYSNELASENDRVTVMKILVLGGNPLRVCRVCQIIEVFSENSEGEPTFFGTEVVYRMSSVVEKAYEFWMTHKNVIRKHMKEAFNVGKEAQPIPKQVLAFKEQVARGFIPLQCTDLNPNKDYYVQSNIFRGALPKKFPNQMEALKYLRKWGVPGWTGVNMPKS